MPTLRQPGCDCPFALHFSDGFFGSDADSGWTTYFTVPTGFTATVVISVDAFTQKDGFNVYIDAGLVLSTGCIAGSSVWSGSVSAGTHTVTVFVDLDCEHIGPGTVWQIDVTADQDRC